MQSLSDTIRCIKFKMVESQMPAPAGRVYLEGVYMPMAINAGINRFLDGAKWEIDRDAQHQK